MSKTIYSYGLKLKLNSRAMGERTSLDYHAKVIDPAGEPHQLSGGQAPEKAHAREGVETP